MLVHHFLDNSAARFPGHAALLCENVPPSAKIDKKLLLTQALSQLPRESEGGAAYPAPGAAAHPEQAPATEPSWGGRVPSAP